MKRLGLQVGQTGVDLGASDDAVYVQGYLWVRRADPNVARVHDTHALRGVVGGGWVGHDHEAVIVSSQDRSSLRSRVPGPRGPVPVRIKGKI